MSKEEQIAEIDSRAKEIEGQTEVTLSTEEYKEFLSYKKTQAILDEKQKEYERSVPKDLAGNIRTEVFNKLDEIYNYRKENLGLASCHNALIHGLKRDINKWYDDVK